ncbi:MAG TPA: alpha/beta hydrolase [Gemmatimonadales bacterium]|nr:alpha/beta hydrolase [Gemmatimonadales bacterium]
MPLLPSLGPLEMTVVAGDGLVLKGVLEYPDSPAGERYPLAVLAHQYPSTADSYAPLIQDLLDLGVATLAFDERGHGSSVQAPGGTLVIDTPVGFGMEAFGPAFMSSAKKVGFERIADDILRVASWGAVQNFVDASRLLLVGASVGGTGVLLAAPTIRGLRGVVTFGAAGAPVHGADAAERIGANVRAIGVPVLLTSSEDDPFESGKNARAWAEGAPEAAAKVVPGAEHAMAIYYDVRDEVRGFVRRALGVE